MYLGREASSGFFLTARDLSASIARAFKVSTYKTNMVVDTIDHTIVI